MLDGRINIQNVSLRQAVYKKLATSRGASRKQLESGLERIREDEAFQSREREFQHEIDIFAKALEKIIPFSADVIKEGILALDKLRFDYDKRFREVIRSIDRKFPDKASKFKSSLDKLESEASTVRANGALAYLSENNIELEVLYKALLEVGARGKKIHGLFDFENLEENSQEIEALQKEELEKPKEIDIENCFVPSGDDLGKAIYYTLPENPSDYAEEFYFIEGGAHFEMTWKEEIYRLFNQLSENIASFRKMLDVVHELYARNSSIAVNYLKDLAVDLRKEGTARIIFGHASVSDENVIATSLKFHGEDSHKLFATPLLNAYRRIHSIKGANEFISVLNDDSVSRPESINNCADKVEALAAHDINLKKAKELLRVCSQNDQGELTECLLNNPGVIAVYDNIGALIKRDLFVERIIELSRINMQVIGQTGTQLEKMIDVISNSRDSSLAIRLINSDLELWQNENFVKILSLDRTKNAWHSFLNGYIKALNANDKSRQVIYEKLLSSNCDDLNLQIISDKIAKLSEKELVLADSIHDRGELIKSLLTVDTSKKQKNSNNYLTPDIKAASWEKALKLAVQTGRGQLGVRENLLTKILDSIPEEFRGRIGYVWQAKPELLLSICEHAVDFSGSPLWNKILTNFTLFKLYCTRLSEIGDKAMRAEFEDAAQQSNPNLYRLAYSWLRGNKLDRMLASLSAVETTAETFASEQVTYNKIFIIGGKYCRDNLDKMSSVVSDPKRLRVYDVDHPIREISSIDANSLVIWVTHPNEHKEHDRVKHNAVTKGARFLYHTGMGFSSVFEVLQRYKLSDS